MQWLLSFVAILLAERGFAEQPAIDFAAFLARVSQHHPENAIDEFNIQRADGAKKKAGVLADPELTFSRENLSTGKQSSTDIDPPAAPAFSKFVLTQSIPWPGALSDESDAAFASRRRSETQRKMQRWQRLFSAADLFIRMSTLARVIDIHKQNLADAEAIFAVATGKLRHGIGLHSELIEAQNEKAVHSLNVNAFKAELENLKEHAMRMMGVDVNDSLQFDLAIPHVFPMQVEKDLERERLNYSRDATNLQLRAERRRTYPKFMAGVMGMQDDAGMRSYGFMGGVSLPIFSGSIRSGVLQQELAVTKETENSLAWYDQKKQVAAKQNARRLEILKKNGDVLRGEIVPNLQQHLKTVIANYGEARANLVAVTTARRQLLQFQLAAVNSERDYAEAILSEARIQLGLIDDELDRPIAQVNWNAMDSNDSGMSSMGSGQTSTTPMTVPNKRKNKNADRGVDADEESPGKNAGGMGGM